MKRKNRLSVIQPTPVQPPTTSIESEAIAAWQNLSKSKQEFVLSVMQFDIGIFEGEMQIAKNVLMSLINK